MQNNNNKPTKWDYLGAAIMGAILGAMLAYGAMGGFNVYSNL